MTRNYLTYLSIALSVMSYAQQKPIVVFDLIQGTSDTLPLVSFDTSLTSGATPYFTGNFSNQIANLPQTPPVSNVFPNSNFTIKRRVADDFNISDFPIRASVKTTYSRNDTMRRLCSGSMISSRHVLSAAHCYTSTGGNAVYSDSVYVCPAFDNGQAHPSFGCRRVVKIYVISDWQLWGEDLAILELEEDIGYQTGWVGIGYEEDTATVTNGIYFDFSYPGDHFPGVDPRVFNGDTLYYGYGVIDRVSNFLGVTGAAGIPGESGTALVKVFNHQQYTSYGVLSFSGNLLHTRIDDWEFYAFKEVISDALSSGGPDVETTGFTLFPNPAKDRLTIAFDGTDPAQVEILNLNGKRVLHAGVVSGEQINLETLVPSVYIVRLVTDSGTETKRLIIR